ncbi:hypothetical protein ALP75_204675 [Pseudomonas syringae pv. actinidiae]|nr:hypothetical protein ALP75_204675 [Pseudomonas syringae pv. actinidiae]
MSRGDTVLDKRRTGRQAQRGLGDVRMWLGFQPCAERFDFSGGRCRADQHAVAAGALGFLDNQVTEVGQHMGQLFGLATLPGRHVLENRLFVQIETNHVSDIRVNRFVIRNAGADGIGQHHIAGAIGRQQARNAQHRIRVERQRIEKRVVEAAVDDIDSLGTVGGAHEHTVIADKQIGTFDQLDTHFASQKRVLEKGAVETPRREDHDARVVQVA